VVVSPAHAGIDLTYALQALERASLPRTRGDRPSAGDWLPTNPESPPHTRGSTCYGCDGHRQFGVSPAHAGIDRGVCRWCSQFVGLPRTRGDRPSTREATTSITVSPPHTRGSTRTASRWLAAPAVSPAHAGIDHLEARRLATAPGLPRTRGDRPRVRYILTTGCVVSPAHAGIDLESTSVSSSHPSLPRTRGDRPVEAVNHRYQEQSPPHTRGSTFIKRWTGEVVVVSPAHAGIDPRTASARSCGACLPRTRGDRPATCAR